MLLLTAFFFAKSHPEIRVGVFLFFFSLWRVPDWTPSRDSYEVGSFMTTKEDEIQCISKGILESTGLASPAGGLGTDF